MARETPSIDELAAGLSGERLQPLYLLYGEESFRIDEAVDAIVQAALGGEGREFNLDTFSGNETDGPTVVAAANAYPMMGERRVVIVREVDKFSQKDLEVLDAFVQSPSASNCLILTGVKPDFRKKPFASLKKAGAAFESKPLYESQVPAWLAGRARRQGRELEPEAIKLLAAYVGTSLRDLQNELDKLSLFAGSRTRITGDDVAEVVGKSKEFTVFELQKAVGARDLRRAFTIAERMLEMGESVPFIIVMLTSYFTTLWKLHELRRKGAGSRELAAEARVNPYFLKEYTEAMERYSVGEVEAAFVRLSEADETIKTTTTDPLLVVETLILRLTGAAEKAGQDAA